MDAGRVCNSVLRQAFPRAQLTDSPAERLAGAVGVLVDRHGHGGSVAAPDRPDQSIPAVSLLAESVLVYMIPLGGGKGQLVRERCENNVLERPSGGSKVLALRFPAYGRRRYLTLGTPSEGWTRRRGEEEMDVIRTEVERGAWVPPPPRHRPTCRGFGG